VPQVEAVVGLPQVEQRAQLLPAAAEEAAAELLSCTQHRHTHPGKTPM